MQAIVSGVVTNENRGGFTSINSSVIQLGSGAASFIGGMIIEKSSSGQLLNYELVGYLSILFILSGILIGKNIKAVDKA
jgi:predicted MFS family arabinose efflux permease